MTKVQHLSPKELAEREGVSVPTVYDWNANGVGPRYMKIGKRVRYRLADVLEWERLRTVPHSGQGDPRAAKTG